MIKAICFIALGAFMILVNKWYLIGGIFALLGIIFLGIYFSWRKEQKEADSIPIHPSTPKPAAPVYTPPAVTPVVKDQEPKPAVKKEDNPFNFLVDRFFYLDCYFNLQNCRSREKQDALDGCCTGDPCEASFNDETSRYEVLLLGVPVGTLPVKAGKILDKDPDASIFISDPGLDDSDEPVYKPEIAIFPSAAYRRKREDCTVVLDMKTAGVTMPAQKGQPGRQGILRKMKGRQNREEENPINLVVTEFEGAPAVEVHSDLGMIGYIPKDRLGEVLVPGMRIDGVEHVAVLGGYEAADGHRLSYGCCFDVRLKPEQ